MMERIKELIAASAAPMDAAAVRRALKLKPRQLAEVEASLRLADLVEWPAATAKGGPRYWDRGPEALAEKAAIAAAGNGPVTVSKVVTAVCKGKAGLAKAAAPAFLAKLEEEGKLFRQPLLADAKYKLTSRLTDADREWLLRAQKIVERALKALTTLEAQKPSLLEILERVEPNKGLLVSAARLRAAAAGLSKAGFDEAVMRLYREGKVILHRHSGPYLLPADEREQLIESNGNFYAGVCWNTGEN